jgi:hypothetical protein
VRDPVRTVDRLVWRDNRLTEGTRAIPEETALALTYNGGTYAVMMGTPQNLDDFAIGFSLSEGVVQSREEIASLEIVELDDGIELRMWLADENASHLSERRRHIDRLRALRNRFDCGGRTPDRRRRQGTFVHAARTHDGDGQPFAVATDQHRDPRRSRRGVLDTVGRHRSPARGRWPPQRP